MRRRDFITLLGGTAVAWPLTARAQQPAMPVIGFLNSSSPALETARVRAFIEGLNESGNVEGRNVAIEFRFAHNDNSRLSELAADLVRRRVAVTIQLRRAIQKTCVSLPACSGNKSMSSTPVPQATSTRPSPRLPSDGSAG